MSSLARFNSLIYEKLFRRTTTFAIVIAVGAIIGDRMVDGLAESIFSKLNEGRLWKDVRKQLNLDAPK